MTYHPDAAMKYIVVHYSCTPIDNGRDYTAADIDAMHRAKGWSGIGYHYFIRRDGTVEYGRDMSKPGYFQQGAQVYGYNNQSIGICYAGGVRASAPNVGFDTRTQVQSDALVKLIKQLKQRYPKAQVIGHKDLAATQCPGFDVRSWWADVQAKPANPFAAILAFLKKLFGG